MTGFGTTGGGAGGLGILTPETEDRNASKHSASILKCGVDGERGCSCGCLSQPIKIVAINDSVSQRRKKGGVAKEKENDKVPRPNTCRFVSNIFLFLCCAALAARRGLRWLKHV